MYWQASCISSFLQGGLSAVFKHPSHNLLQQLHLIPIIGSEFETDSVRDDFERISPIFKSLVLVSACLFMFNKGLSIASIVGPSRLRRLHVIKYRNYDIPSLFQHKKQQIGRAHV